MSASITLACRSWFAASAERVSVDAGVQAAIADGYEAKYPYRPTGADFWRVAPDHVLAWSTDELEAFASTPTQFDFGGRR